MANLSPLRHSDHLLALRLGTAQRTQRSVALPRREGHFQRRTRGSLFSAPRGPFSECRQQLTDADIAKIAGTYHAWRGDKDAGKYADVAGFCKSVKLDEVRSHGHVLTPGRYVGAAEVEDDGEPFEQKMKRLTKTLEEQFAEGADLEQLIRANLRRLGATS